jgi:hypothetical protein
VNPLVSVIVPVYKTEAYLRQCVESLLAQTWEPLEIILVDDGSPDGAGALCDAYGARFPQVRVIHQENGGVARARNAGLEAARGEYIAWVDSDDWAAPDMVEYLMEGLLRTGCSLAFCGCYLVQGGMAAAVFPGEEGILPPREARRQLYADVIKNWLWNKLARRSLYEGLRFPEVENFEDIFLTHRLFRRAGAVLRLPEPKYYYRQRPDSLSHIPALGEKLALCRAFRERFREAAGEDPDLVPELMGSYLVGCSALGLAAAQAPREELRRRRGEIHEALEFLRRRRKEALAGYPGKAGGIKVWLLLREERWAFRLGALAAAGHEKRRNRRSRWEPLPLPKPQGETTEGGPSPGGLDGRE